MGTTTSENNVMPLVRVLRTGQVTLPAELRRRFKLNEGDLLEAAETEGGILLRPVSVVDREKAWEELMDIIDAPKRREPPAVSPEVEEEWIAEQVKDFRKEHAKGRS